MEFKGSAREGKELVHRTHFECCAEAADAIFDYLETFYNRQRLRCAPV